MTGKRLDIFELYRSVDDALSLTTASLDEENKVPNMLSKYSYHSTQCIAANEVRSKNNQKEKNNQNSQSPSAGEFKLSLLTQTTSCKF